MASKQRRGKPQPQGQIVPDREPEAAQKQPEPEPEPQQPQDTGESALVEAAQTAVQRAQKAANGREARDPRAKALNQAKALLRFSQKAQEEVS